MKRTLLALCLLASALSSSAQLQWNKIADMPDGGNIIDIDVDSAGTVYALTSLHTTIFYSTNNGSSWQAVPNTSDLWNANAIEVDKATGALYISSLWFGVISTLDMGAHWREEHFHAIPGGFYANIQRIGVKHGTGLVVAAENTGGAANVFISTNSGTTWSMVPGVPWQGTGVLKFLADGTLLAGVNQGVFRSADNGFTWSMSTTGIGTKVVYSLAEKTSNGHLFAGVGFDLGLTDTINCGVYRSTDNGNTWTNVTATIANHDVRSVEYDAVNNKLYAASTSCIYVSSDEGTTWTAVNAGLEQTSIWCVAKGTNGLFAGTSRMGVMYAEDPAAGWNYSNSGIKIVNTAGLALDHHGNGIHCIDEQNTAVYNFNSTGWHHQFAGLPVPEFWGSNIVNDGNDVLYTTYLKQNNGLYRSVDHGATWTNISGSIPGVAGHPIVLYTPFVDNANNLFIIANFDDMMSNVVYRSADSGNTWTTFFAGDPMGFDVVTDIDFASNAVYLTHTGMGPYVSVTFDGGSTFDSVAFDFGAPYEGVISVAPNDSLYMEMFGHIYKRLGIGNWVQLPDAAWNPDVHSYPLKLYIDRVGKLFASSFQRGVFTCADDSTWTNITIGLPTYSYIYEPDPVKLTPDEIAFSDDNIPYAICSHRYAGALPGIYKFSMPSGITNQETEKNRLSIYPNPATDRLAIKWSAGNTQRALLQVYDIAGKVVLTKEVSQSIVALDITDLTPGVYILKVTSNESAESARFIKN